MLRRELPSIWPSNVGPPKTAVLFVARTLASNCFNEVSFLGMIGLLLRRELRLTKATIREQCVAPKMRNLPFFEFRFAPASR